MMELLIDIIGIITLVLILVFGILLLPTIWNIIKFLWETRGDD